MKPPTPTMRAATAPFAGGPEAIVLVDRPIPAPAADEIRIAVSAAGVNRADILQRTGKYPPPPGVSDVLGLEVAGEVAAVGSQVRRFRPGDRVMALLAGGGYAEHAVVPEAIALPLSEAFSFVEGAAIPEVFFTVRANLFGLGRLTAGETALVHGGASGIGTAAIQLARAAGARVIVTAGTAEKCTACLALGADVAIDYRQQDFVAAVKDATGGRGADVILDIVGGDYVQRNYAAAAADGRIVQIATQSGVRAEVDLRPLMAKRLVHTGSVLRPRETAFKAALAAEVAATVFPLFAAGKVRPVVDRTYPLAEAAAAHRRLEASLHVGKIVLTVP